MPHPIRHSETDACPGALRLHQAADGPLARVRLPGGRLTGAQLATLASVAADSGDGNLELTSRANVQLRALTRTNPTELAARLSAAGLLPSPAHETVRNIAAPPLADPRARTLVTALDAALCADPALTDLPGRFLFAIGTVPLTPDVAAVPAAGDFAILFAGHDEGLRVAAERVVEALLTAAHAFLAARADQRKAGAGKVAWRLAELPGGVRWIAEQTAGRLGISLRAEPALRPGFPASPVGVLPQPDGRTAVGAIVPLGRLTGVQMRVLAEAAHLVVTPWRGVVVADLPPSAAAAGWQRRLTEAGLPAEPDSRWTGVTACAGRPGCAKSRADIRADALAATRFVEGLPVHWLGCERGCGSPAGPHVRVEATPTGYAVTTPDGTVVTATASHPTGLSHSRPPSPIAAAPPAASKNAGPAEPAAANPHHQPPTAAHHPPDAGDGAGLAEIIAAARRS